MVIGQLQLDRREAGRGRGGKPSEHPVFGEEIGEIGSKARHANLVLVSRLV